MSTSPPQRATLIDKNTPPVGRHTATSRLPQLPAPEVYLPWWKRRKRKPKAPPKPSNLVPKVPSPKVLLRRANKAAMAQAANGAVNQIWEIAKDLASNPQFGRTATWWYRYILQTAKKGQGKRGINLWNVFLHKEVQKRNEELPLSEERRTIPSYAPELSKIWNEMSKDEQVEATKDAVEEIKEMREAKVNTVHNLEIAAFHDVRANVASIEQEVRAMHNRTGVEAVLIVVRSQNSHLNHPHAVVTSQKVLDFFQGNFALDPMEIGQQLESFCLSGVRGLQTAQQVALADLRNDIVELIKKRLREFMHLQKAPRINYASFDTAMTENYGIIIVGWPLEMFCCPSQISSRVSLEILHNAWLKGDTKFARLTPEQVRERRERRLAAIAATATPVPAVTTTASAADNATPSTAPAADPSQVPIDPTLLPAGPSDHGLLPAVPTEGVTEFVFAVNGAAGAANKKRKQRKDKGVPRGPYKKKAASVASAVSAASVAPVAPAE